MSDERIIEVRDLDVERGEHLVLKEADFQVKRGDYVGIVGPNGGGKTTLIKAMLGILPHSRGEIRFFGEPINSFDGWEKIAYVSQHSINFDENFPLTVRELVGLGRISSDNLGRRLSDEDWRHVDEALDFMGLTDLSDRRIGKLSGGQKQRAFVAKAMVRNPEVLFLDEPVTGIDAKAQKSFYMRLSNLNLDRGTTIMIVSHDLAAVFCRMSKVLAVNQRVYVTDIDMHVDPNRILRKAYGEHFHFTFHKHLCEGLFDVA
ncbi:MAG: metal ABC transporter ATP-binding protein [Candidatus Bathyarchaeia archaeon]